MAEEQSGLKKDYLREFAPWTKLFSAFKVAMDPKKLLLAGAGILAMALGWWILAAVFFSLNTRPPMPEAFNKSDYDGSEESAWKAFKDARRHWNLTFEMAGEPPATRTVAEENGYVYDAADFAESLKDWNDIKEEKKRIEDELARREKLVKNGGSSDFNIILDVNDNKLNVISDSSKTIKKIGEAIDQKRLRVKDIKIIGEGKNLSVTVDGLPVTATHPEQAEKVREYISKSRTIDEIKAEVARNLRNARVTNKAIELQNPKVKSAGRLRTLPWFEDRGPNPYLLVTGNVKTTGTEGTQRNVPWERGEFFTWLGNDQAPVLLEPLIKFLRPIVYLLDPAAGGLNRIYLFLVILWTLAVWGFFGGAITRMAAVQIARQNEKVSLTEAVRFAYGRYKSFFLAPLFPLIFLAGLTLFLVVFGLFEKNIPLLGDVLGGLLWPVILLVGFIMAIVLVGLVGWPLMYPTISTEGSDSFDAISRSYSYIYQAPWQYVWYIAVALVYGAVLIFFVGLMGSLMVYMSKWGVAQAPAFSQERDPEYLFMYAPTSFGWRDLLLYKAPDVETVSVIRNSGQVGETYALNKDYVEKLAFYNYIGAFLVSVWLYILFLMVVGFGYSYFWSVSTIIYILMRRNVDDTEMDEVHLEQTEPEVPYPTPPPATNAAAAPAPAPAAKPGGTNLTLVEPPTLRPPANPTMLAPPTPPPEPVTPPASGPSASPSALPASPTSDRHEPTQGEVRSTDGATTPASASESSEAEEKKP